MKLAETYLRRVPQTETNPDFLVFRAVLKKLGFTVFCVHVFRVLLRIGLRPMLAETLKTYTQKP